MSGSTVLANPSLVLLTSLCAGALSDEGDEFSARLFDAVALGCAKAAAGESEKTSRNATSAERNLERGARMAPRFSSGPEGALWKVMIGAA